jgi:hypothetical protein
VVAIFFLVAARLFYLQIIRGEHYYTLSENNCIRLQRVKPFRGLICDRNGRVLVENRPSFDMRIVPRMPNPWRQPLTTLPRCLELPVADLALRVSQACGGYGYQPGDPGKISAEMTWRWCRPIGLICPVWSLIATPGAITFTWVCAPSYRLSRRDQHG